MNASSQRGLNARRTKWNLPAKRRILGEPGDRRDFPVAEMAGEDEHALALLQGGDEGFVVLDPHQRRLALGRHEAVVDEFAEELQQMAVVRLREPLDLLLRDGVAIHAAQILQHDRAAERQESVEESSVERHLDGGPLGLRHRRRAAAIVRHRHGDRRDAMAAEHRLGPRPANDARRAVVVARDREVGGHDRAERRLAREELDARFLRGEAGGEARGAPGARRRCLRARRRRRAWRGPRPASRRAGVRSARSRPCRCRSGRPARGHPPSRAARVERYGGADDERRVGAGEAATRGSARPCSAAVCAPRRHRQSGARGVERLEIGDPRHDAAGERRERQRGLENSGGGDRVPDRPLECR